MLFVRFVFIFLNFPSWGSSWEKPELWNQMSATILNNPIVREECRPNQGSSPFGIGDMPEIYKKCKEAVEEAEQTKHPLIGTKTDEIIEFYGYSHELHDVTTKDGYIITLHRIPSNGTSVLLWHGLGGSSDNWVFNGPTQSFAFILADLGYDVWLGNSRGTSYSLGHETLSPDTVEYWDFSWHENGMFDLPASIKHIRKKNNKKPIFYVGHSQGTSNFMVGASTKPASKVLSKKNILAAFLLAPAGFLGRNGGTANRLAAPALTNPTIANLTIQAFGGKLDSKKKIEEFTGVYLGNLCSPKGILCGVCTYFFLSNSGFDPPMVNYTNIPHILDKYPNTIPIKSVIHYAQSLNRCTFRQFDYGEEGNSKRYGSDTPPDYKLKSIKVPTYIYWGPMDFTCTPEDVERTKNGFREDIVKGFTEIEFEYFNHNDFVTAIKVKELVYDQIVKEMQTIKPK